jgi:putative DNA primase/helicase
VTCAGNKDYFDRLYRWQEKDCTTHLLHWLQRPDLTGFDPRSTPVAQAPREEQLASLPLVHQFMLAELETSRPFSGMACLTSTELVERFFLWNTTHHLILSPAAARAMSGKLMQRLGTPV